ncbi:hypothetical protein [Sporomusa sp.]|uniref:hypothetical protein n=1 Tax=Sporomusa sp. TaxID=2078658 RepID=UPI002C08D070|nr:hypothetical protein [Sporomusa sp.]HWR45000.1 hypothetical protein [Sporomusa sp.]
MLWLIITVVIAIALFTLLRPRQTASDEPDAQQTSIGIGGSMGSMMTGMMLGYLVSNFLIDSHQYAQWRGLSPDALKEMLAAEGVMTDAEFDNLSDQIAVRAELNEVQNQYMYQDVTEGYADSNNIGDIGRDA